jgi:hypothetical protein
MYFVTRHSHTLDLSPRICKFHLLQLAGGHHGDIRPSAALRSNQLGKHARERRVEIARAAGISAPLIRALCVPADRVHCVSVSRAGIGFQLTFLRRGSLARARQSSSTPPTLTLAICISTRPWALWTLFYYICRGTRQIVMRRDANHQMSNLCVQRKKPCRQTRRSLFQRELYKRSLVRICI